MQEIEQLPEILDGFARIVKSIKRFVFGFFLLLIAEAIIITFGWTHNLAMGIADSVLAILIWLIWSIWPIRHLRGEYE